jgi:peptidoglycan hydrolase-like protein with peptidoglycan-binding domain
MGLRSAFFRGVPELEAAAASDPDHLTTGAVGDHVGLIQQALLALAGARILSGELDARRYGPSTATAVLNYKRRRNIINPAYQIQPDDIVGKMTMAALDEGMLRLERTITSKPIRCNFHGDHRHHDHD